MGAPKRLLQKFYFLLAEASAYPYSSFVQWGDDNVQVIHPLGTNEVKLNSQCHSFFNETQFESFMNPEDTPLNEYDKLIWKFIYKSDISINDVSLYTGDALFSSVKHHDIFFYTPIIVYIIRRILNFN